MTIEHVLAQASLEINIIAKTDSSGKITYVNDLFCEISGYSEAELLGQDHRIINSGYHSKEFWINLWQTIKSGHSWRGEIKNKRKDGSFYWVDTYIKPYLNESGELKEFIAIRKDITQIKEKTEQDLKQAKFAAIGETTAQILHDIMNPLTIIKMGANSINKILLKDNFKNEDVEKVATRIENSAQKIVDIFEMVRSRLQNQNIELKSINLVDLINNILSVQTPLLKSSNIDLIFNYQKNEKFHVQAIELQLEQVILNLIKNASEAISTLDEKWIEIDLKIEKQKIKISITDSGWGIAPELQSKIWNNLFTTKIHQGGTGLGLGICKSVIKSLGGEIEYDATSPNTSFVISLIRF